MTAFWFAYTTLLVFLGGLCIGSFLNVCIYRIPLDKSVVAPRSFCFSCGETIRWYDNLPVLSYLLLGGKCRRCGGTYSIRYPFVELLTGVLFLAIWNRYGLDVKTPLYWIVTGGLIVGTFVDLDHFILPDRITIGGMLAGPLVSLAFPSLHGEEAMLPALLSSLTGLVVGSGTLLLVRWLGEKMFKKEAMGLGDVKLLGAIGAFLGWGGVIFTVLVSSLVGSIIGLGLIAFGGLKWRSRMPYGPYIAIAAAAWMLGGDALWHAYIDWITFQ